MSFLQWPNDETERYLTRQPQKRKPESYTKHWIILGIMAVVLAWCWFEVLTGGQ